ncbi:MAG: hypothetical protein WAU01_17240, partial [Saprospiraceae bacterium]
QVIEMGSDKQEVTFYKAHDNYVITIEYLENGNLCLFSKSFKIQGANEAMKDFFKSRNAIQIPVQVDIIGLQSPDNGTRNIIVENLLFRKRISDLKIDSLLTGFFDNCLDTPKPLAKVILFSDVCAQNLNLQNLLNGLSGFDIGLLMYLGDDNILYIIGKGIGGQSMGLTADANATIGDIANLTSDQKFDFAIKTMTGNSLAGKGGNVAQCKISKSGTYLNVGYNGLPLMAGDQVFVYQNDNKISGIIRDSIIYNAAVSGVVFTGYVNQENDQDKFSYTTPPTGEDSSYYYLEPDPTSCKCNVKKIDQRITIYPSDMTGIKCSASTDPSQWSAGPNPKIMAEEISTLDHTTQMVNCEWVKKFFEDIQGIFPVNVCFEIQLHGGKIIKKYYGEDGIGREVTDCPPNSNIILVKQDSTGKLTVETDFKDPVNCPPGKTCSGTGAVANEIIKNALKKMEGQDGKIDPNAKNTGKGSCSDTSSIGIVYEPMGLAQLLASAAKGYNSLVSLAKVPDYMWKRNEHLDDVKDKNFPVKDGLGLLSGSVNAGMDHITEMYQLVGLGLTVISDPEKACSDLADFATNIDINDAIRLVQGMVGYDSTLVAQNYGGYVTGSTVTTVVIELSTVNASLIAVLVSDKLLKKLKKLDDILGTSISKSTKSIIANFSDKTLVDFANALKANPDFLKWIDDPVNEKYLRGMVNHKLSDLEKQDIGGLLAELAGEGAGAGDLAAEIESWLLKSEDKAKFLQYIKKGKEFEANFSSKIIPKPTPLNAEYQKLLQKIPDLNDRTLLQGVQLCINTFPCNDAGSYFIPDFVAIKVIGKTD